MDWSEKEVRAAIHGYFKLFELQQKGEKANKTSLYRELASQFPRSAKSFERKFQNISAILYELHLPYCDGLKPAFNYQRLLRLMVLDHVDRSPLPTLEPHEILFSKLNSLGDIKVDRRGAGRFGLAIESALGIQINSSKDADFMGIELKTKHDNSLQTLFSRVPTRYTRGYDRSSFFAENASFDSIRERRALYTSFSSQPDSLGFNLKVNNHVVEVLRNGRKVMEYDAEGLEEALLSKHSQTAFVSISPIKRDGKEFCRIDAIKYCKWPSILRFLKLASHGEVFLDFTLSERLSKIKDHGFLWRIPGNSIDKLYLSKVTDLS